MFTKSEILETVKMIDSQNLDVRTITLALSLFDCVDSDAAKTADKVYEKIVRRAEKLVSTGEEISAKYGVPIVNKRVSVTPVSLIGAASGGYKQIALAMDRAAKTVGVDFIGGYTALVHKGMTGYERAFLDSIPEAIASTDKVCCSVNVASTKAGINMDAVAQMGEKIIELSRITPESIG